MSGPGAPQQVNGADGRPLRAPSVVSLAVRATVGLDSVTKGYGSGARVVTALDGVTVAFAAAAQASAGPIWLLIGLIVAFAAVALLNTALMATAGRHVDLTLARLIGGTRQQAWRISAREALITTPVGLAASAVIARIAGQTPPGQPGWHIAIPPMLSGAIPAGAGLLGLAGALAPSASSCMPGLWPGPAAASKAPHVLRRSA